jgi:hypothetical protein
MTVIAMSRTEIDRMSVLQDLAASRIKVTEAATLMRLGRRQVFRLAKAYARQGPAALVSRRAAGQAIAPTLPIYAMLPLASFGSVTRILARRWRQRSLPSFMAFTWRARRFVNG